ncbi:MAG: hypothetical protein AB7V46_07705 [Thermomicrobiales bacterium]
MPFVLAQVSESAEDYDSATIALLVVFVVVLVVTAGLFLRDILSQDQFRPPAGLPFNESDKPHEYRHDVVEAIRQRGTAAGHVASSERPAWFQHALTGQSAAAAEQIRALLTLLVDAANRGDLRQGFALYTPELLARQQQAMGFDASAFERLLRSLPSPPAVAIDISAVKDLTLDPPSRATALVQFTAIDGSAEYLERMQFQHDSTSDAWLIDSIEPAAE